ncbi:hypothetical protein F4778DRAFT_761352 [Xylariomycetidae sp. FL2044]|nr:hypothetical protein F4778DRAFT_761352 [Xylariomycetidae sp. FL2044]
MFTLWLLSDASLVLSRPTTVKYSEQDECEISRGIETTHLKGLWVCWKIGKLPGPVRIRKLGRDLDSVCLPKHSRTLALLLFSYAPVPQAMLHHRIAHRHPLSRSPFRR